MSDSCSTLPSRSRALDQRRRSVIGALDRAGVVPDVLVVEQDPRHAGRIGHDRAPAACRNRTDDLLITRRKVTITSTVFRRASLQGTYLRCPNFSSVSSSSLHEWLHAAVTTPPSAVSEAIGICPLA